MIKIEMEMADKCSECRFRTEYEFCSAMPKNFCGTTLDEGKPDWCPLKNADGWISVKDRLPDKSGTYLCYQPTFTEICSLNTIRWSTVKNDWMGKEVGSRITGISHWMPLPEKPEEETEDDD